MSRTAVVMVCVAFVCTCAFGQSSAPAKVDLLKGAVDPYDNPAQRNAFLAAAGKDNELDAKEFAADAAKGGFSRKFDSWDQIILFDKNQNGTLDWFEFDAYRSSIRKRILFAFDKNADGKLTGAERDAANDALAKGNIPAAPADDKPTVHTLGGNAWGGGISGNPPKRIKLTAAQEKYVAFLDYDAFLQSYDGDHDGKLTGKERQKAMDEYFKKYKAAMVEAFDANHDGQVDQTEMQAMGPVMQEGIYRQRLAKYDANKNGKLDPEELKKESADIMEKSKRAMERMNLAMYDDDGDGKLSDAETKAMKQDQADMSQRFERQRKAMLAKYDKDGDGKMSAEENKAYQTDLMVTAKKRYADYMKKVDTNGDGNISMEEHQAYWKKLMEKYDKNKDGQIQRSEQKRMYKDEYGSEDGMW